MIKKIILLCVIIIIGFWISAFQFPSVSRQIEWFIWLDGLTDTLHWIQSQVNQISTDIPSLDEVKQTYTEVYSWALDIKDSVVQWLDTTKESLDGVRKTLSGAEDIYNEAKDTFDSAKQWLGDIQDKLDQAQQVLEAGQQLWESLSE